MLYDIVIIGTGVAGLSAGLYAGRYRMKTLILGEHFGGETAVAGEISNYPGVLPTEGFSLVQIMRTQVEQLDVELKDVRVDSIKHTGHCFEVRSGDESFDAKTIILATGAERRHLGLEQEKELTGKGVHYCITCDGPLYTGKTIAVVGGGDASVKGVNLAAQYVKKIYLLSREKELIAEPVNFEEMKQLGDKVEVFFETQVTELMGSSKLEKVALSREVHGSKELVVDGLFIEIGAVPDAQLAKSLGVVLDEKGYIAVDAAMRTSVDGVFAAGDVTNHFGRFKQDITAAAQGAVAATSAYDDFKHHGELCTLHALPLK